MMKQLKSLLIATVLFFGVNQAVNAQTKTAHVNNTAHVNVSEIMAKMPAMLEAQKQLETILQLKNKPKIEEVSPQSFPVDEIEIDESLEEELIEEQQIEIQPDSEN